MCNMSREQQNKPSEPGENTMIKRIKFNEL